MKTYELLVILNPEEKDSALDLVKGLLTEHSAEIYSEETWGLRTLAYPIKKHTQGRYWLAFIEVSDAQNLKAIIHELNMLDEVLRFNIVAPDKTDKEKKGAK